MTNVVHATPPLELDGVGTNTCYYNCYSQLLTTTKGHDVIIVMVDNYDNVVTIADSSGLTFTQRISSAPNGYGQLWEFYAVATSPLKSDNITVVADNCCTGMQVVAIHGANTRAIFDQSPSIPATCSGTACGDCEAGFRTTTCSVSIQTSTIDFVVATTAINDAPPCGPGYPRGVVPGFTNIANQNNRFEVDYAMTIALGQNYAGA